MTILNYIFTITQYFSQDVFNILLILSFIISLKNWKILKSEKILISIGLFVLYGLILTIFVENQKIAFVDEIYIYTFGWLLPFILGYCCLSDKHKHNVVYINIYIFAFLTIVAFFSYYGIFPEKICGMRFSQKGILKINAIWHVPFAARCILVLIVSFTISLFSNLKPKFKILFFIFSIIFYIAILLSTSRLYFIVATLFYILITILYIYKTKKFKLFVFLILILSTIFSLIYFTTPIFKHKLNKLNINKDISLITRVNMYKYAVSEFKKYPIFGVGPAQAMIQKDFYNLKTDNLKHTHLHSMFLHVLANYGIVGFMMLLFIIICILYELYIVYNKNKSILALSMIFVWLAVLLADNFDFVLKNCFTSSLYFWFTGLALSKQQKQLK